MRRRLSQQPSLTNTHVSKFILDQPDLNLLSCDYHYVSDHSQEQWNPSVKPDSICSPVES